MEEEDKKLDPAYAKRAIILFSAFVTIVLYIETMLIPSLPAIAGQYHINAAEVSLIVSLYLVSGVALNPIVGKLGDIYGKKRVLMYILPIYVAAVAVTGFAPNFTFILVSRFIQGIGLTIFPLVISLVQEEFPRPMVPRALAILTAMFGVGSAIGLPLGSFISNAFGWQFTYHTALPFVVVLSILMMVFIRESRYKSPQIKVDYVGAAILAIGLAMLVFALSEGVSYGWTSTLILGLFVGSIAAFAILLAYERRIVFPILNFKLLRVKNVLTSNTLTLFVGLGFFFSYQIFAYLFESKPPLGFGFGIFQTGLSIAPFAVINVIVAPIVGRLIPKTGVKPFFIAGSFIAVVGFLIAANSSASMIVILGETIVGMGLAFVNIPTINLLVLSIDRREMGTATAMNSVFRFLGSALGAPIAGVLIAQSTTMAGFQLSFYLAILAFIIVAIISLNADEILGKNKKIEKIEEEVSI